MEKSQINWKTVRVDFENDMSLKFTYLPGHREVAEDLRPFRSIISHELPETTPKEIYNKLIKTLLSGVDVDLQKIKDEYLYPELVKENKELERNPELFNDLKESAFNWVEKNLPEKQLQFEWDEHKTWLPRRYTIYKNPNEPFQRIASDTLARYYLITSNAKIRS